MNRILRAIPLVFLAGCAAAATPSRSITGNFASDADSPGFAFTLSAAAPVTIRTWSYAGGTNAAGVAIPRGGFDPTVSLFDSVGNLITLNRDGGCANVAADSVTSYCWDSFLNVTLPAGAYTVVITQSENLPNGPTLGSSFVYAGQGSFTTPPTGAATGFWDLFPSQRTSAYAFDIASSALVIPAPVVTPVTIAPLSFNTSGSLGEFIPGANISGTFGVTGGLAPYSWSAAVPAGLSLNDSNGAYSGTAGNPGFYNFTVQVNDSESPAATATLNVSYSVLGITTSALPNGSTARGYSASVAATGGTGPYNFSATGLPTGLGISSGGSITGTPQVSGTFSVAIQVSSGGLSTSVTLTLVVTAPQTKPLTVSGGTLPAGVVAVAYSGAPLLATGGTPPYTWSVFGGALPGGMSLAADGTAQGTPTATGAYGFTAQVTDSAGAMATGGFTLQVNPSALNLKLSAFPNGVVGADYPTQILTPLAAGGTAPYTFTVTVGSLPAGLSLTGQEISGTPTGAGTISFTITVTDANGKTATAGGSITVTASQGTLILSQSSVGFSLTAGASGVGTPASVTVRSSNVAVPLNFSLSVSPAASWLDVSGGGLTPGSLTLAIDPTAPSLPASPTAYGTTVTVSCVAPSPCAGQSQTIGVSLSVTAPPPQLTASSTILSFTTNATGASSQSLGLENIGGGTIDISSVTVGVGANWLSVSGIPTSLTAGPGAAVTVTANPLGLSPGYYTTSLTVSSSVGSISVPVTLLITQGLTMTLAPAGSQFSAPTGSSPGNVNGMFSVSATGTGTLNWSASLGSGANWITLGTSAGTSTASAAGLVTYSLNSSVIAALAPGVYYATITVSAPGAADTSLQYQVVLNVTPSTTAVNPVLSSAGLVFTTSAASPQGTQTTLVYSASANPTAYQASAITTDGASWLTVTPGTGFADAKDAAQSIVSVNATGLAPGVYSGDVSYAFSSDSISTVNVTLLVEKGGGAGGSVRGATPEASTSSCTPTQLIGTQTGLYNNFAQAAGWPTPLSVNVMNDCGTAVNGASLTTTFSNGDPPMALSPRDSTSGVYVGTWTPRNPAPQVTVTATASLNPFAAATTQVTGQVRTNVTPILTPNGTLDVFNPVVGTALAPGQVVQIYGQNLAAQTLIAPVPLPTSLGGTSVLIGGKAAPLFYVSAGQIDAQIPFELTPGTQYQMLVEVNGSLSTPAPIQIVPVSPALANLSGQALATHLDGSLVNTASPAQPSEYIVLYLSGLGATTNPVPSGQITPSPTDASLLSVPLVAPGLSLNGVALPPPAFVGLTPTAVGLYQIDFQVPADAVAGNLPLVVSQGGMTTNTIILPVE